MSDRTDLPREIQRLSRLQSLTLVIVVATAGLYTYGRFAGPIKSTVDVGAAIEQRLAGPLGSQASQVKSLKGLVETTKKRVEAFEDWKRNIAVLSQNSNVVMKLGGIGMPLSGFDWHKRDKPISSVELAAAMSPHYLWCIEQFGSDRCMFESNFPVDKNTYSYTVMWNAAKRLTKDFSIGERANLFHDTAVRAYRL